ncbi:hypothetical protein ACHAXR_000055 [Thalassiosira sp. AJA248-18]
MKEERRKMASGDTSEYREKNKKAAQHSKTKTQQQLLSKQLVEKSEQFVKTSLSLVGAGKIPTVLEGYRTMKI